MRQLALSCLVAVLVCLAVPSAADAALRYQNALTDSTSKKPLACPDPHVIDLKRSGVRYVLVCTTDTARDALTIHLSSDLVHWELMGSVFPRGRQPWWAMPSGRRGGRFWAPEIYRIGNQWVIYFSAMVDRARVPLPVSPRAMVIGVATSQSLEGPWRTRILHYRGQYNATGGAQESFGGVIDPSVARNPADGKLYLFWNSQANQVWMGGLAADGLSLDGRIRPVLSPSKPWECHPSCTIEAPEPFFRGGVLNLLYSAASTWDGSYVVGLARGGVDAAFQKLDQPVLQRGPRFIGPGHSSQPVTGPDGQTYLLYHAMREPNPGRVSNRRVLMLSRVTWAGDRFVVNSNGHAD